MSLLRGLRGSIPVVAGIALSVLSGPEVYAQGVGGVAGRVVSTIASQTGDPVPGVTIRLPGLLFETETDDEGRFEFFTVPTGGLEIRAEILGCQLGSRTVAVREDEVVGVDFIMSRPVIAIPGLVVSGLGTGPSEFETPLLGGAAGPRPNWRGIPVAPSRIYSAVSFLAPKSCKQVDCPARRSRCSFAAVGAFLLPSSPWSFWDGVITGGGTIDINPRDVEDILVLKGSAASAPLRLPRSGRGHRDYDQTRWDEDQGQTGTRGYRGRGSCAQRAGRDRYCRDREYGADGRSRRPTPVWPRGSRGWTGSDQDSRRCFDESVEQLLRTIRPIPVDDRQRALAESRGLNAPALLAGDCRRRPATGFLRTARQHTPCIGPSLGSWTTARR